MIKLLKKLYNKFLAIIKSRSNYKFLIKDYSNLDDFDSFKNILSTKRFTTQMKPLQLEDIKYDKIIVIAPHPDDDVLGAGGTLLKAKSQGVEVHVVYVTNGDPLNSKKIIKETLEVCKEAEFIPHFLNFEPKNINVHDESAIKEISDIIKEVKPGAIFISFFLDNHIDHRLVNQLLYNIFAFNNFDQNIEIWSYQIYSSIFPNVVIDVTEEINEKNKLIMMWKSVSKFNDLSHYILGINASNSIYLNKSEKKLYGEAFFVIPAHEYLKLLKRYFQYPN